MRNLKKILALALVFAMAFTFTASAADFTDAAEIGANYVDDVNMLVELGVIAGYPDGSFGPQKNITRAEFAKMAYTIKYGSDTDGNLFAAQKSNFWDVEGNASVAWAKGYINYCANQNIVSGVGGGKFNPQGNITVAEATKMLLVILGCDPAKEGFTGANWVANVTAKAIDLGIYNGWTGDPSQLATRELVAKLMHNTIFSSVYTYSAITGAGSQLDALGQDYNKTLGEVTMNLQKVTGIVVANERYALATDEEGEELQVNIPNVKEDESVVYFEKKDDKGNTYYDTITLDRALDDDMLGAKVNVYFTADTIENSGRLNYKNIEVIGNVLVHSDTVAYTVPAIATKVMPDGESTSNSTIRPYISFTVDGVEKQIVASKDVAKVAKSTDAATIDAVGAEFNKYAYVLAGQTVVDDGDYEHVATTTVTVQNQETPKYADLDFISGMNTPSLEYYRFVSVDGGETYSYLFKTVDSRSSGYGAVTSYSEARGTIKVTNTAQAFDLDEVVLVDEVAVDDYVVYYRANGKVYIEKVDALTAAVDDFTDDNGVILGGNAYYAWTGADIIDYSSQENIYTDYYKDDPGALNANTKYLTFGNLIMQIESDDTVAVEDSNYAVILNSYYDEDEQIARVKLGFADNTYASYNVGKLYTPKSSDLSDPSNNKATDFADNAMFGLVVQYKILANGTVDLSAQDFLHYNETGVNANQDAVKYITIQPNEGKIVSDMKFQNKYALNDATVIFALYGNPDKVNNVCAVCGAIEGNCTGAAHTYKKVAAGTSVAHKAYVLSDLEGLNAGIINGLTVAPGAYSKGSGAVFGSYIVNTTKTQNNSIVAAAITVGSSLQMAGANYDTKDNYAYVVSATQRYNRATDLYYAEMTLINDEGIFTAKTVDDVQTQNSASFLDESNGIGKLDALANTFVVYDVDAEGTIIMLDTQNGDNVSTAVVDYLDNGYNNGVVADGFYQVNIVSEKNGIVSFYDAKADYAPKTDALTDSLKFHEDGCTIVAIGEDSYEGSYLTKVSSTETKIELAKVGANAVIQIHEGEIARIYSFVNGFFK